MYDLGFDSCDDLGQEPTASASGFVRWNHRGLLGDLSRFLREHFAGPACLLTCKKTPRCCFVGNIWPPFTLEGGHF